MRSEPALLLACAGLAAIAPGCARTVAERSVVDDRRDDPPAFWSDLETRRIVTNNDALHGLMLSVDDRDPHETYEARLRDSVARGWLPTDRTPETMPANTSARMGDLAMAACKIADIQGGLTMTLFGLSPRYATRELVAMEVIPDRSEGQAITGLEFIEFASRVQDRLQAKSGKNRTLEERLQKAAPVPGSGQAPTDSEGTLPPEPTGDGPPEPPAGSPD